MNERADFDAGRRGTARLPRLLGAVALGTALWGSAASAWAGGGALFGEASRTASLADAVTARPGELSAIFYNPGALADLARGMATVSAHVGRMHLSFARHDEPAEDDDRTIAGFELTVGTRMPGPQWLRAFRLGVAAHVPAQYALRLSAPSRPDEPSFPLYGDRAERISVTAALAAKLFERIGVGIGVTLAPTLYSPTKATYVAGRGSEAENVVPVFACYNTVASCASARRPVAWACPRCKGLPI